MHALVKQLLHISDPGSAHVKTIRISEWIEETLESLVEVLAAKHIEFSTRFSDADFVAMDVDRIRQVLHSLILNAVEAMDEGGHLNIKTDRIGEVVIVEISDDGKGIEEEHLQHVFHPFYTTKKQTYGMGLPMVRSIIEDHGGLIAIESEPEAGTKVMMRLPINPILINNHTKEELTF